MGDKSFAMAPSTVSALAEAAWVVSTQTRLENEFGFSARLHGLKPNPSFGSPGFPAFQWGYHLAQQTREVLDLSPDEPVDSMRTLVEETFGIPMVQCNLAESVAGATLEVDGRRAIVVNLSGWNRYAWVRRVTLAHELGHLLFDPSHDLDVLRVDEYNELEREVTQVPDVVEQRANAFAVELLAPQSAILTRYREGDQDALGAVMDHFGVGATTARFHIWNASDRKIPLPGSPARRPNLAPTHWDAKEAYTMDYHVLHPLRPSRAGRFSALVVRAAEEQIISWDTAAEWLGACCGLALNT
jgi:Zn-dependent peptidase ImmA (M78 family)